MKESFESFLFTKLKVDRKSKFLLAVSGGMDSMTLWHLFRSSGLKYVIAHCNFKLRGGESDLDESFVKDYATKSEKVFTKSFETQKFANEKSVSIQMAARELRYTWFEELRKENACDFIVTAHHLDDQIETFFIQLLRKSSLPGLSGIPVKTQNLLRPLMFIGKESIETYINNEKIPFREDASNASDIYLRNKIRRNLIPVLQKVLPDFKFSVLELMGNMKEVSDSMEEYFEKKRKDLIQNEGQEFRIEIQALKDIEFPLMFLENYMKKLGFGQTVARNLYEALDGESGKVFFSSKYRAIKDRTDIIILPLKLEEEDEIEISKSELMKANNLFFKAELVDNEKNMLRKSKSDIAFLDFDELEETIKFRKWKHGDYFYPLGLGGKKKVSDYFIDHKFSLAEKETQWIMCSNDDICWIVGHSIDDRFKIRENTMHVLILEQQ